MAKIHERPIDVAHRCSSHLHAITDLIAQAAADGGRSMELVNPDKQAVLLDVILTELDDALDKIASQLHQPQLRTVQGGAQ
ncbi:MAG: hypothetical protein M0Q49_02160 [Porticoccaceae bacterium]|nr:hypothetical protein [Porticoccaceae bacterium]